MCNCRVLCLCGRGVGKSAWIWLVYTINNLNKFLSASVRRCFRKFLKNTGRFQPCPLDVLKSFLKTQGGFRAARWMLFVAGRFRLSADSRIQVSAIRVDYFEPQTQNRFPFNWRHKPFLRCFAKRMFCGQDFFVSQNQKRILTNNSCLGFFLGCDLSEQNGTVCGQEFFANSW